MNDKEIFSQKEAIEDLFDKSNLFIDNPEMLSHWAKYLCVLTSGFIENSIKFYLTKFSSKKAHQYVVNYVTNKLSELLNPKMDKILTTVGDFSQDWRDELEKFVDGERKAAIDSIIANRHQIAHGKSIGLTFNSMKQYFKKANEVIDYIEILSKR